MSNDAIDTREQDARFMREAIRLADESIERGGGPFGAVIVKEGTIVAGSANSVTLDNDPTAHAEVKAIRQACHVLDTFSLKGCTLYTSCEPCPMCLGAIYWAGIDFIYDEFERPLGQRSIPMIPLLRDEANLTFQHWSEKSDKITY